MIGRESLTAWIDTEPPESQKKIVYPYIPNSVPATKEAMLKAVNAASVEEFYADIPDSIRLKRKMKLPAPLLSEAALERHVDGCSRRTRPPARR